MTKAEEFEREKRLLRITRRVFHALVKVQETVKLNPDIGTVESRDAGNALDEAMAYFVEGSASLDDVEAAFKNYVRAIRVKTTSED